MKIDCNDINVIKDIWFSRDIIGKGFVGFVRGSALYGTYSDESDVDIGIIVPDDTEFIDIEGVFDNGKCDTRIHPYINRYIMNGTVKWSSCVQKLKVSISLQNDDNCGDNNFLNKEIFTISCDIADDKDYSSEIIYDLKRNKVISIKNVDFNG